MIAKSFRLVMCFQKLGEMSRVLLFHRQETLPSWTGLHQLLCFCELTEIREKTPTRATMHQCHVSSFPFSDRHRKRFQEVSRVCERMERLHQGFKPGNTQLHMQTYACRTCTSPYRDDLCGHFCMAIKCSERQANIFKRTLQKPVICISFQLLTHFIRLV